MVSILISLSIFSAVLLYDFHMCYGEPLSPQGRANYLGNLILHNDTLSRNMGQTYVIMKQLHFQCLNSDSEIDSDT